MSNTIAKINQDVENISMIYHILDDILYVIHFDNISRLLKVYIITQQVTQDIESILKPKGFALTKRGTIAVKGKGDMVIIIIIIIISVSRFGSSCSP